MSGFFAASGLAISLYVYFAMDRFKGTRCAEAIFFFTMEFLQFVQYSFIAENLMDAKCEEMVNKVLTALGFLHICLQPYYTHILNASMTLDPSNKNQLERIAAEVRPKGKQTVQEALANYTESLKMKHAKFSVIQKLCLIGGALLFARFGLAYLGPKEWNTLDFSGDLKASSVKPMIGNQMASTEWLRGGKLCTWKGNHHLAWSVPMADPSYNVMGAGIHSFLMFAPFLAVADKFGMGFVLLFVQAAFLWLTGPGFAAWVSPNLHEQASIWCFVSIAQIFVMVFVIFGVFVGDKKKKAVVAAEKSK